MPETIPQEQQTLRCYFKNGNKPVQENFWEFIDTMFYLYQLAVDDAAALEAMTAGVPTAWVDAIWLGGAQGAWTYRKQWGVTSVELVQSNVTGGVKHGFKVNFAQAFADVYYVNLDFKYIQGANVFNTYSNTTVNSIIVSGSTKIYSPVAPPEEGTIVRGVFF